MLVYKQKLTREGNHWFIPMFPQMQSIFFFVPLAGQHELQLQNTGTAKSPELLQDAQYCSFWTSQYHLCFRQHGQPSARRPLRCLHCQELVEKPDSHTLQLTASSPPEITVSGAKQAEGKMYSWLSCSSLPRVYTRDGWTDLGAHHQVPFFSFRRSSFPLPICSFLPHLHPRCKEL